MPLLELQPDIDRSLDRQVTDFDSLTYTSIVSATPDTFTEEVTIPQEFLDAFSKKEVIDGIETDENGRFLQPERPMELKWSAFDQIWIGKEVQRDDGKTVVRIAAISIPKESGMGHRMGEEGLRNTLGLEKKDVKRWKGEEGALIGMRKDLPPGEIDLSIIGSFIENSGKVVKKRYPYPEHPAYDSFFKLQQARRDNLAAITNRADRILQSKNFIGMAAMTEEQKGAGGFVLELEYEDGILYGADPNGKRQELKKMMIGKVHKKWGRWGEKAAGRGGNFVIGHVDDTRWVSACDGSESCSKFFNIMEQSNAKVFEEKTVFINDQYTTLFTLGTIESAIRETEADKSLCDGCGEKLVKCTCDKESNEVAAGGEN